MARMVFWQELGASLWAIRCCWLSLVIGWRPLLIAMAVIAAAAVLNQLRTLAAHLWTNEGEPMTVTAQYLDTVNVPPPGCCPRCGLPSVCAITPPTTCCRSCPITRWLRRTGG